MIKCSDFLSHFPRLRLLNQNKLCFRTEGCHCLHQKLNWRPDKRKCFSSLFHHTWTVYWTIGTLCLDQRLKLSAVFSRALVLVLSESQECWAISFGSLSQLAISCSQSEGFCRMFATCVASWKHGHSSVGRTIHENTLNCARNRNKAVLLTHFACYFV